MIALLRYAALSTGLVCGWSTLLLSQSTSVVIPDRTQIRRALPTAPIPPTQAPAQPVVQQSPNGLYKLSITDTGIELSGPRSTITLNDAGILIRIPGTYQVEAKDMTVKADRNVSYRAGSNLTLEAASNVQIKSSGSTDVSAAARASFTGSNINLGLCSNARPAARLGDPVNTTNGAIPFIAQGSPTVLVC
jgi:hypothetical protein